MDVSLLQVPPDEVERKLKEYRATRHRAADNDYVRIRKAYEAAEGGKPLIILSTTIANSPRDELGRPKLAIARADRTRVFYSRGQTWSQSSGRHFEMETFDTRFRLSGRPSESSVVRVPVIEGVTPPKRGGMPWQSQAPLPLVPPDAKAGRDLSKLFVLWEVEEWKMVPPVDPYLLKRVADDLFVVLAAWDLTAIERAVMQTRLNTMRA